MNYPNYAHGGYVDAQVFERACLEVQTHVSNYIRSTSKLEPTKEEKTEILNKYIEENKIEHDEKHLYLYKKVNLENKADNMMFEIGKTYVENINGFDVNTMKSIICSLDIAYLRFDNSPQNPSALFDKPNYKILKLRVSKEHIKYILLGRKVLNASQIEVMEEVDISPKLEYKITSLIRETDGSYEYRFALKNIYLNKTMHVTFKDKINLTQEEIQNRIKQELEIMQIEYDQYQASIGSLEI